MQGARCLLGGGGLLIYLPTNGASKTHPSVLHTSGRGTMLEKIKTFTSITCNISNRFV